MIILTGGAGFIGSRFLKKLNDEGVDGVIVVDRLGSNDKWKNLIGKRFLDFIEKDEFIARFLSGEFNGDVEAVFHLGARSSTTERNADFLLENNYAYSRDIAERCAEKDIRLIYASSAATYGMGEKGYSDERFDLKPLNMYGYSKHLFDKWVVKNGLDAEFVGLKFFNVFGANEYHKGDMASMVYKAYNSATETGKIRLFKSNSPDFTDGEQKRDFIYVDDVVDIMFELYMKSEFSGIYNIGTGTAESWNNLAKAVFKAAKMPENIEYYEMPENLAKQYQNYTCADMTKFKRDFGAYGFTKIDAAVGDYVEKYLSRDWKYC